MARTVVSTSLSRIVNSQGDGLWTRHYKCLSSSMNGYGAGSKTISKTQLPRRSTGGHCRTNNICSIVRHLRIEAEWHLSSLEHGNPIPVALTDDVRQQIDSAPMDFQRNFKALEESYACFVAALGRTTEPGLRQLTLTAYQNVASESLHPTHLLGFHQATHLAMHLGQIRSIRNLYRKLRGKTARFVAENPSFPS